MKIDVEQAAAFLKEHDNYLILMHASPDGDTLGCGTALCGALQRLGKHAKAVCPDTIPVRFEYMFVKYTGLNIKAVYQTIRYSGIKNLIKGKGIICCKHCVLNIDKTSKLQFEGLLILGLNSTILAYL